MIVIYLIELITSGTILRSNGERDISWMCRETWTYCTRNRKHPHMAWPRRVAIASTTDVHCDRMKNCNKIGRCGRQKQLYGGRCTIKLLGKTIIRRNALPLRFCFAKLVPPGVGCVPPSPCQPHAMSKSIHVPNWKRSYEIKTKWNECWQSSQRKMHARHLVIIIIIATHTRSTHSGTGHTNTRRLLSNDKIVIIMRRR